MQQSTTHPQVTVTLRNQSAEVDEGIAELILACWRRGIQTTLSCQDSRVEPGQWLWIQFLAVSDAEQFSSIAAGEFIDDDDSLYARCTNFGRSDLNWQWSLGLVDLSVDMHVDETDTYAEFTSDGPPSILFSASVRLPWTDYFAVLERLNGSVTNAE